MNEKKEQNMWLASLACFALHWVGPRKATAPVAGHCSATVNSEVFAFGGLLPGGCTSQTRVFRDSAWRVLTPEGGSPAERMYAASAGVDDKILMCGGWDPGERGSGGIFFDDLWLYSPEENQWQELPEPLPGGPVSRHTLLSIGNSSVLIHTFRCDDHVLLYNHTTRRVERQNTTGPSPRRLSMMSASWHPEAMTAVFSGGADKFQKMSSDVFLLDLRTWTWTKTTCHTSDDEKPPAFASASALCLPHEDRLMQLVFGGGTVGASGELSSSNDVWIVDVDATNQCHTWYKCFPSGVLPPPRVASCLDWVAPGIAMLHGGWKPETHVTHSITHFLHC